MVALALVVCACAVWSTTLGNGFINIDDPAYVTQNPIVQGGLSWAGVRWAFTDVSQGHWHPLTWLCLMLEAQLWGPRAAGYHLTSVLLHVGSILVLFELLRRSTSALWRSALVAAAFGLHPLRVESVAWVSERKDTLSVFLGLLCLAAYVAWTQRPSRMRYAACLGCFALSLSAKATLVTLPCVLLLVDFWPLGRLGLGFRRLVLEKLPFALVAAAFTGTALWAEHHGGAFRTFRGLPLSWRLETAALGYVRYAAKLLVPRDLSFFYALGSRPPALGVAVVSAALVLGSAAAALMARNRAPALTTGWLWFLGTLLPLSGIVPVWSSMADRYSYFPSIGFFLALVFSWPVPQAPRIRAAAAALALLVLGTWSLKTVNQIHLWRDSLGLAENALDVEPDNPFANMALGLALEDAGRFPEAEVHLRRAVTTWSWFNVARYHLGRVLLDEGRPKEAAAVLGKAQSLEPEALPIQLALLKSLEASGDVAAALRAVNTFLVRTPGNVGLREHQAILLDRAGRSQEAAAAFRAALAGAPASAQLHYNFGVMLARNGRFMEAAVELREATRLEPDNAAFATTLRDALDDAARVPQPLRPP